MYMNVCLYYCSLVILVYFSFRSMNANNTKTIQVYQIHTLEFETSIGTHKGNREK